MTKDSDVRTLGGYLSAHRAQVGGSLAAMAQETRISETHLRALEAGDFSELPAPVFVKGFVRAYCGFLGIPAEEALALYHEAAGTPPPGAAHVLPPRPQRSWIGHPVTISLVLLATFGGGLLALNVGIRGRAKPAPPPIATAVPAPAAPGATAAPPSPPAERPPAASPEPPPLAPAPASPAVVSPAIAVESPAGQRLVVKAVEPTWIRVQADDGRVVEELLAPGVTREWTADKRFLLTIGNAGGIEIALNGRALPSLGARGAVIHRLALPGPPAGS